MGSRVLLMALGVWETLSKSGDPISPLEYHQEHSEQGPLFPEGDQQVALNRLYKLLLLLQAENYSPCALFPILPARVTQSP